MIQANVIIHYKDKLPKTQNKIIISESFVQLRKSLEHDKLEKVIYDYSIISWKKVDSIDDTPKIEIQCKR